MQRKKSYSRDFLYSHRKYALVLVLAGEIGSGKIVGKELWWRS
jgi:hypothetical protein